MMNCENAIERVLHGHQRWLTQSEQFLERQLDYLHLDLAQPLKAVPGNVADSLAGLGFYWGVKAVTEGWVEKPDAPRCLGRSIEYYLWSLMIREHGLRAGGPGFSNHIALLGSVLCSGIAYGAKDVVAAAAQLLLRVAAAKHLIDPLEWQDRRFEPFALRLWSRMQGSELPPSIVSQDVGAYAELLSSSIDESAFHRAGDFHCSNMEDRGQDHDPEFKAPPFDLVPVDLLAAIEVMHRSGQVVSIPEHPLLTTPLARLAVEFAEANSDPDLEQAQSYYVALEVEG
jgi:hypothetical protein